MSNTVSGESLALRVTKGIHTGALIPLTSIDLLLIGAGDDCDVILSDSGVARHHCILALRGDLITIRAVAASVTLQGKPHEPGNGVPLACGVEVGLGDAGFEVVTHAPDLEPANGAYLDAPLVEDSGMKHLFHRSRWVIGLVLLATVVFELQPTILNAGAHSEGSKATPAKTVAIADEHRRNAAVAQDVAEVLRLSGIPGEAAYEGDGTVSVRGHLGDPANVATVVQSRAMHEIAGLKKVRIYNLDQPPPSAASPASAPAVEPTRIILAIGGNKPCVVTADGSRYYVGATLPQGGRLRGVQDGDVLIERSGHIVRVNPLDERIRG